MSAFASPCWSPWPALRNCVPAWARWFVGVASALLLGIVAMAGVGEAAGLAIVMCVIAVALAWMLWFWKLVLLHLEARTSRVPGLARAVGVALLGAWLGTVVLPAILLARAGGAGMMALSILTIAAAGGMLVFLLPRALLVALCLMPMLLTAVARLPGTPAWPRWQWDVAQLPWMAAGMALLAAACWRFCLRWAEGDAKGAWWQPLALAQLDALQTPNAAVTGHAEPWRMWAWLYGGRTQAGPATPVRAMRSLIGGAFSPLTPRRLLMEAGVLLLLAVVLLPGGGGIGSGVFSGILIATCVAPMAYGQRLVVLYRQHARELDELALLPGWGNAANARALLLRAVIAPPLIFLLLLIALLAVALSRMPPPSMDGRMLALAVAGGALLAALTCLRPLAGLRTDGLKGLLVMGPGALVLPLGVLNVAAHRSDMLIVLLLACAAYALAVRATWRRFLRRPHPFLQD